MASPELEKIVSLSECFKVSTDYLLKDNITEPTPPQESALKGNKRMSWRTWLGGSLFGISALIIFVLWRLSVRFPISGMTGNGVHLTGFSGFLGFHGILHESYVIVAIGIIGLILVITDFIRIKKNNRWWPDNAELILNWIGLFRLGSIDLSVEIHIFELRKGVMLPVCRPFVWTGVWCTMQYLKKRIMLFRCLYAPRHTAYKTKKIIFIWKYGGREYCSKSEKPPPAKRCFFCGLFNKRLGAVEFVLSYRFGRFLICSRLLGHWCRAPPLPICFPQKTNRM